jgi:hypothetical protein
MNDFLPKVRISAAAVLLCLATIAVYSRVYGHEFLHYDDDVYVTDNPQVRSGLSLQSAKWAFKTAQHRCGSPLQADQMGQFGGNATCLQSLSQPCCG